MKVETMRPAVLGTSYGIRGEVVRMGRQVAYAEATVTDAESELVSRSTSTFLLHRPDDTSADPPA
jgi:acyl-coenzyme A thioesterase PaaI-like protein